MQCKIQKAVAKLSKQIPTPSTKKTLFYKPYRKNLQNGKIVLPFANGIAETLFKRYSLRNFAKTCYACKNLTPLVRLLRKMQRFCNGKFFEKQTKMRQKLPLPTFLRHFFEQIAHLKSISLALQNILC